MDSPTKSLPEDANRTPPTPKSGSATAGSGHLGHGLADGAFDSLLRWTVFAGLMCLGGVILWDYGFLNYMFASDTSRISFLIVALFIAFSGYCLFLLVVLSRELRLTLTVAEILEADTASVRRNADALAIGAVDVPFHHAVGAYLRDVATKEYRDSGGDRDMLLQSLAGHFRVRTRVGTYAADLLYKLGMLGTVIGFVIMLNSMGDLSNFDVETLRGALQKMTGGMAVALLTTIAGLVCGMLLRVQFNIAEALASRIMQSVMRLTEVSFVPLLRRAAADV